MSADRLRRLVSFVARRVRRRDHAEDYLGDALLRVYARYRDTPPDNVDAVIVKTAVNVEIDSFRRERRRGEHVELCLGPEIGDAAPLQDEILIMRERLAHVRAGIAELPPRSRQALLLRRIEGLSYREIAQRMQISEGAVEKHISRGMRFLSQWSDGW